MQPRESIHIKLSEAGLMAGVSVETTDLVVPLSRALLEGGIRAIEIDASTPDAPQAIRNVIQDLGNQVLVGMGTVLNQDQCHAALEAGAQFVVTPVMLPSLIPLAHQLGRPIILGAYSPTEAQAAYEAGADMIHLFPADGLGPGYIKSLRAPLPHLNIVPTGGVNLDNMEAYFKAGCFALGVGSSLVSQSITDTKDWPALIKRARQFTDQLKSIRK